MGVSIIGTGSFVPSRRVSNAQLFQKISNFDIEKSKISFLKKGMAVDNFSSEKIFDLWVQRVCGIKSRPFVDEEISKLAVNKTEVEYMGYLSSLKAIEQAKIDKREIDQVIFSTYSTNRTMPSAACSLVNLLELQNASAITMNGACSGFLDGLIDAVIKIESGHYKTILVVASEQLSNKMDYDDPKTAIIFSDGAGAVIVQKTEENKILGFASGIDYSEQVYMERKGPIFFNSGPLVERNAVRTMFKISQKTLEKTGNTFKDVDYIIPHQANLRIIDSFENAIKKHDPDYQGHVIRCIENYGNLSSATVPVALDLFIKGVIDEGIYQKDRLFLFCSVGGGYTFGSLLAHF